MLKSGHASLYRQTDRWTDRPMQLCLKNDPVVKGLSTHDMGCYEALNESKKKTVPTYRHIFTSQGQCQTNLCLILQFGLQENQQSHWKLSVNFRYFRCHLLHIDGLVQGYCNSSVSALELLQSYTKPLIYNIKYRKLIPQPQQCHLYPPDTWRNNDAMITSSLSQNDVGDVVWT